MPANFCKSRILRRNNTNPRRVVPRRSVYGDRIFKKTGGGGAFLYSGVKSLPLVLGWSYYAANGVNKQNGGYVQVLPGMTAGLCSPMNQGNIFHHTPFIIIKNGWSLRLAALIPGGMICVIVML